MPFGLMGAPATFSRLMDKVLDGLIRKKCQVYLDDVIIFGSSFEETLTNLKLVMVHLRDHNLLCKGQKYELFETSIAFLGRRNCYRSSKGRENMQQFPTERQVRHKKHIGTWKLLQAIHQELLCNNSPSTGIVQEVCTLQVGRQTGTSLH